MNQQDQKAKQKIQEYFVCQVWRLLSVPTIYTSLFTEIQLVREMFTKDVSVVRLYPTLTTLDGKDFSRSFISG